MHKVAIFSGTFDPIHNGHLEIAEKALQIIDEVAFIAEPKSWTKKDVTNLKHRDAMIDIAITNKRKIKRLGNINDQPHTSQNIKDSVLRVYKSSVKICLLMGADSFLSIASWQDLENCKKFSFIVASRAGSSLEQVRELAKKHNLEIQVLRLDSSISSSQIREGMTDGTPLKVAEYIDKEVLYEKP